MKKFYILFTLLFIAVISSCDLTDINDNPNQPIEVPASNILGTTFVRGYGPVFDFRMNCNYAGLYCGQISDRVMDYEYRTVINNYQWNDMYNAMRSAVDAMQVAQKEENSNLYAAALVMKVFYGNKAVNCWGDIPYSEIFQMKAENPIMNPKYDSQKDVYIQQLAELKEAADIFDPNGPTIGAGDLLFYGDIAKWQKFANSMRLRLALRANSGEEGVGTPTLEEVMGNSGKYPTITTNDDNAYWWFPGVPPYEDRWYIQNMGYRDERGYKISQWRVQIDFVENMINNNDPRTPVYFDKNIDGKYTGWIFGIGQRSNPHNRTDSVSAIGDRFVSNPAGFMPFYNAAETYFNMAEAYLKGYVAGGDSKAREAYEKGIKLSCEENGIEESAIATFLAEPEICWTTGTTSKIDKIALQRWIVLFKQSIEAWTEVRRTDIPKLTRVCEQYCYTHNRPPFRLPYSEYDKETNANFPEIDNSTWDLFYGPQLWWDKRAGVY